MAIGRGTDVEYLGSGSSGGVCMGETSSELIGFYGKAPIARQSVTAATTTATTTTNEAAIVRLTAALVALGLIITS